MAGARARRSSLPTTLARNRDSAWNGLSDERTNDTLQSVPMKPALESDVDTLDGILHTLYEVLSGPAGQPRDWERFRSLFIENARLIVAVAVAVAGDKPHARQLTVEDYIRRVEPIFAVENFW